MLLRALVFFCVSSFLVAGSCLAGNVNVTVGGGSKLSFSPNPVTINQGDTVTFTNAGGIHNVIADDGSFCCDGGACKTGSACNASSNNWSSVVTFNNAGNFGYYCSVHGAPGGIGMAGHVIVNSVTSPTPAPIGPTTSGAWYNTQQGGHGFLVEILPNNVFLAVWFVFTPDGSQQSWVYAQTTYDPTKNTVTISSANPNDDLFVSSGGMFPPNFDKTKVTRTPWGSITFTFTDCNNATVQWNSTVPGYGTNSLALSRLSGIAGLDCHPTP